MPLFSQRKGLRPVQKAIQRESIDQELRNRLWSALSLAVWDNWMPTDYMGYQDPDSKKVEILVRRIWMHYFKLPLDTLTHFSTSDSNSSYQTIRDHFFKGAWFEVYDFIEFALNQIEADWQATLKCIVNDFLQEENAAYRIVDFEIIEITNKAEIEAIESAIDIGVSTVSMHFQRSLDLLSDRKNPDYRNAIKEAISGVESACQVISGKQKATLTDCLKSLKDAAPLHPAFEQALIKLYGYTSDEGGIRHALSEQGSAPSYADAKFMLVASSSFVNYLWTKASELKLKIVI